MQLRFLGSAAALLNSPPKAARVRRTGSETDPSAVSFFDATGLINVFTLAESPLFFFFFLFLSGTKSFQRWASTLCHIDCVRLVSAPCCSVQDPFVLKSTGKYFNYHATQRSACNNINQNIDWYFKTQLGFSSSILRLIYASTGGVWGGRRHSQSHIVTDIWALTTRHHSGG